MNKLSQNLKRAAVYIIAVLLMYPAFSQVKHRKLLLRDEGLSQLSYVDLKKPKNNWYVPVPVGRDIQLVGNGRVLLGTGTGYEERLISDGSKVFEITSFEGTQTAHRLRNGNTLLAGANWRGKEGITLLEIDNKGSILNSVVYPGFSYVRCIRETQAGTYMVTSNELVFEGDKSGKIVWQAKIAGPAGKTHIWQAQRLANGETLVSSGYAGNFQVFSAEGKPVRTFTGTKEVNPNFFAGFQILKNGHYVVTNWQGHGPKLGASGHQVLEFTPDGSQVWSWKQDPAHFSSLQGVIVLDGLNTKRLHVEDANGMLTPVK